MALVKFGGGIIEMRGAIAGTVFSRNSSGNYARAKTTPINPQSPLQTAVRSVMAALTTRWSQVVTAAQRAAWDLYASNVSVLNRLGESVNISGFNHYIRSNANLLRIGETPVDAGPVVFEIPEADPIFAITASEATQEITATFDATAAWALEDGAWLYLFQDAPQNPQINFFDGPWRLLTSIAGVPSTGAVSPDVSDAVFAIAELQREWVYARIQRADGRLSEKFRADTFCAA